VDVKECIKKGFIRKISVDIQMVASLIDTADAKEIAINKVTLNEENISVYMPVAYDSLRIVMEAFCLSNGYKVLSHVCVGELLKDLSAGFDFTKFDRFRYIRNNINYYGRKINLMEGKGILREILIMKKEIKEKIQIKLI